MLVTCSLCGACAFSACFHVKFLRLADLSFFAVSFEAPLGADPASGSWDCLDIELPSESVLDR